LVQSQELDESDDIFLNIHTVKHEVVRRWLKRDFGDFSTEISSTHAGDCAVMYELAVENTH
jgi:hypothetical protein